MSLKLLKRVLKVYDIPFSSDNGICRLRRCVKKYILQIEPGQVAAASQACRPKAGAQAEMDRQNWPRPAPSLLKEKSKFCLHVLTHIYVKTRHRPYTPECAGISSDREGSPMLLLCEECHRALMSRKLPALSLANSNYLGPNPLIQSYVI